MRKTHLFIYLVLLSAYLWGQQDTTKSGAANVRDSLEFLYSEKQIRLQDSLQQDFEVKQQKFLNKYNVEREQYANKIKTLADSIEILKSQPTKASTVKIPQSSIVNTFDKDYEARYFQYLTQLKDIQDKGTSLFSKIGIGGEKLIDFKLLEMSNYIDKYFPHARCAEVQSFIIDLCLSEKMYAAAEMELLKYAHLYINHTDYSIIIDKNMKAFEENRYYKNRLAFVVKKVNSILKNTPLWERYFRFVELLNTYPEETVRGFFLSEGREYLIKFIEIQQSAEVVYWMALDYRQKGESHKAFVTAEKLMNNYPEHSYYALALHLQGQIQEEYFNEYREAVAIYEKFINKFPDHEKTEAVTFKIAQLLDTELKDYEGAVSYYKQFADKYQKSEQAVQALQRAGEIYNKEMKALQSSVETYALIEKRYPNTKAGIQALLTTGALYEDNKYYTTAVVQYAEVYKKYPKTEESLKALEQSALIYLDKLDDQDNAIKALNLIIEYFPDTKNAKSAAERLESITEKEQPPAETAPKQKSEAGQEKKQSQTK